MRWISEVGVRCGSCLGVREFGIEGPEVEFPGEGKGEEEEGFGGWGFLEFRFDRDEVVDRERVVGWKGVIDGRRLVGKKLGLAAGGWIPEGEVLWDCVGCDGFWYAGLDRRRCFGESSGIAG